MIKLDSHIGWLRTARSIRTTKPKLFYSGLFIILFLSFGLSFLIKLEPKDKVNIMFWTFSTIVQAFMGFLAFAGMLAIFRLERLEGKLREPKESELAKIGDQIQEMKREIKRLVFKTVSLLIFSLICLPLSYLLILSHLDFPVVVFTIGFSIWCLASASWLVKDLLFD